MILTKEIEKQIIEAIAAEPEKALVLPDHAYGSDGRVIVLIDGLPIPLHRHLHEKIIGPLGIHQKMHDKSGVGGNVNPHLFVVVEGSKSPHTHCPYGHKYEGNEMPPNSRGYRCRTCYRNSYPAPRGTSNAEKTVCPQNHPYDDENTYHDSAGRRRCRICKRDQGRKYAQRRRSRKEQA